MKKNINVLSKVIEMLEKETPNALQSDDFEEISYRMQVLGLLDSIEMIAAACKKNINADPVVFPDKSIRVLTQGILVYLTLIEKAIPKIQQEEDKRFAKAGTTRKKLLAMTSYEDTLERILEQEVEAAKELEKKEKIKEEKTGKETSEKTEAKPSIDGLLAGFGRGTKKMGDKN